MKTVYTILAMVLSLFFAQAQSTPTPGTTQQAISTPLYVFNNNVSGNNLQFEPRTHNYADYYQPICHTFIHSLAAGSSIVFADPTQVGVPLHLFGTGNVLSIHSDLWPTNHYYTLMSPTDFFDYGTTQKWHTIKFAIGNLGDYLYYGSVPGLTNNTYPSLSDFQAELIDLGYTQIGSTQYYRYSNEEVFNIVHSVDSITGNVLVHNGTVSGAGNTATWIVASGMNIINVI